MLGIAKTKTHFEQDYTKKRSAMYTFLSVRLGTCTVVEQQVRDHKSQEISHKRLWSICNQRFREES